MTTRHAVILGAALIVAIAGGLVLHAYIGSRVDLAKLDAIRREVKIASDKSEAIAKQAEQDRLEAQKRDADRDRQLTLTLASIAAQKAQPVTAEQVAQMITARIPQTGITAQDLSKLPDAPSAQKNIRDYMLDCDSCKVERDSMKQAVVNRDQQISSLTTEKQSLVDQKAGVERERDAAIKAAKGNFWKRVANCGVKIGIGAAAGGLTGDSKKAGAGAAIGIGACFLTR